MTHILDQPILFFLVSILALSISAWIGGLFSQSLREASSEARSAFGIIEAATLTLLGLIVAFTFSMALNRYDQRKNLEEEEANAIGTEYFRADLLAGAEAAKVRELLRSYLRERIRFYTVHDARQLEEINATTVRLQAELWSAIRPQVVAQPTQIAALVVQGMNDVFNTQGYTQAAWWNRIPIAAWILMAAIAVWTNALVGYGTIGANAGRGTLLFLPLAISIAFALIADIDDPRGGGIQVTPLNLLNLARSLPAQ
jgi:hypothetical protein